MTDVEHPQLSVEVVLCTCDGEAFLAEQLGSIAGQERPPDRVLVADDASTDASLEIVESFASDAPFEVTVLTHEQRVGPTSNFERGLSASSADVVFLADQDDRWYVDKIARMLPMFADPAIHMVLSDMDLVGTDGSALGETMWHRLGTRGDQRELERRPVEVLLERRHAQGAAAAVSRSLIEMALPFPDELEPLDRRWLRHDGWLSLLAAATGGLRLLDGPTTGAHRVHPGQVTGPPLRRRRRSGAVRRRNQKGELDLALRRCVALLERVGAAATPDALDHLRDRERHLIRRRDLQAVSRQRRTLGVIREAARGGYRRHALGLRSMIADLVGGT